MKLQKVSNLCGRAYAQILCVGPDICAGVSRAGQCTQGLVYIVDFSRYNLLSGQYCSEMSGDKNEFKKWNTILYNFIYGSVNCCSCKS